MTRSSKMAALVALALILLIVVVGIGLAAFEYWRRGTPRYSLNQIAKAVQTHDLALFRKHVDVRSVTSRLIDDMMKTNGQSNELGSALIGLMKPQIIGIWESQIERFVETGNFEGKEKEPAIGSSIKALHEEIRPRLGSIVEISREGKVAALQLTLNPRNEAEKTTVMDLKMRQTDDGYWQLIEVSWPRALAK